MNTPVAFDPSGQCGTQSRSLSRSLDLYRVIFLIRTAEEAIIRHYGENQMKTAMHMSMGQEAAPTGLCVSLQDRAEIVTSYRSHASFLARTRDVTCFFGEMYGRVTGTAEGKSGSMHLASLRQGHLCSTAIVGAGLPLGVGAAFANKRLANGRIVVVMFGDGATEEGSFWETMNVASLMRLPIIFACEDNDLAVHTRPDKRRGFGSFEDLCRNFRMPYLRFDDNDPETALRLADEAKDIIDTRHGPVFFHALCYRYLEHVGINTDFHIGYRDIAEYENWRERDCLAVQRRRLVAAGMEQEIEKVERDVDRRVVAAVEAARQAPFPDASRLTGGIFHEAH